MFHRFLRRLVMATVFCVAAAIWLSLSSSSAQTQAGRPPSTYKATTPAFKALPREIQTLVTGLRQSCIDVVPEDQREEFNYVPANEMSGIHETQLGGRHAIIIDNFDVCTSDVTGGNCHNRGCPVSVWLEMDAGVWRKVREQDQRIRFDRTSYEPQWLELVPRYQHPRCKRNRGDDGCGLRWTFRRLEPSQKIPRN